MTHNEAVDFLRPVSIATGEMWADLGAGQGRFSKAIADYVGRSGRVYAVDKNALALKRLEQSYTPKGVIQVIQQDFTKSLALHNLDGILMANSLHYVRAKEKLLKQLFQHLKPSGALTIIEYNIKRPNPWVPFPIAFDKLEYLAEELGLSTLKLATRPSAYHHEMYLARLSLAASLQVR